MLFSSSGSWFEEGNDPLTSQKEQFTACLASAIRGLNKMEINQAPNSKVGPQPDAFQSSLFSFINRSHIAITGEYHCIHIEVMHRFVERIKSRRGLNTVLRLIQRPGTVPAACATARCAPPQSAKIELALLRTCFIDCLVRAQRKVHKSKQARLQPAEISPQFHHPLLSTL